jgi:hypothetical protein
MNSLVFARPRSNGAWRICTSSTKGFEKKREPRPCTTHDLFKICICMPLQLDLCAFQAPKLKLVFIPILLPQNLQIMCVLSYEWTCGSFLSSLIRFSGGPFLACSRFLGIMGREGGRIGGSLDGSLVLTELVVIHGLPDILTYPA